MRVLVTGATGFIGFHTARRLVSEGHAVRALVRSAEKGERVLGPLGIARSDRVVGDMTDPDAVAKALEGCDAAVHAAAGVSVTARGTDFDANLSGTETVIGAAVERGLHVVYLSSVTAIFHPRRPVTADAPLVRGKTRYGRSKTACDAYVRGLEEGGAPVAIVYPPGVIGPDDPGLSESVKAARRFLRGTLDSEGGLQSVDVRDLALLVTRMLERRVQGRFVAAGHFLDWNEVTATIEQVTGAKIPRVRAPGWVLRGLGRTLDVVGRLTGRTMPMTGEGLEIATRFREMADTPGLAELGVSWRAPTDTFADLYGWLLEAGKLPPSAVPAIAGREDAA